MIKPLRAALYHRVSTADQDQAGARDELRAAAIARGMTATLEIEETGSGARNDRPGLAKVMEAAMSGKVEAVLVRHLDRFGRSALDLLANIQRLDDAGVRFIAVSQALDIKPGGDAMSRLILTVLSGVAAFEREMIRERSRLGLAKARKAGKRLGRPPVEVDLVEARQLRDAGASYASAAAQLGVSVGKLHAALKASRNVQKGEPTAGPVTP